MRTVGLISLGCPKNLVDSEVMLGLLAKEHYRIVQDPSEAEVLIVNTCSFIEDAKKESIDTILEMAKYKVGSQRSEVRGRKDQASSLGRCEKLIVTGCLPQRYRKELMKLFPEVDAFVGAGEYHRINEILNYEGRNLFVDRPTYIHDSSTPRMLATPKHAVYVKIAEGCYHCCSFCVIPQIRGRFRSRSIDDIVSESKGLVAGGAKELNLIGQDTTSYGRDLKDGTSLARLLKELSKIEGDFWIRVMYAYPTSVTDELIEAMAGLPKVCKYLDIPIQHISDKILSLMSRKERGVDIRALINKLKGGIPDITLRTSIIVGFPRETKKDFDELLRFVKEGHFDRLGAFAYSQEEGSRAARLRGQVGQDIKDERLRLVMKAQAKVSKELNGRMLGRELKTLIVGREKNSFVARTEGQAPDIDGIVVVKGQAAVIGEFVRVKITNAGEYDLEGKLC